MLQLRLMGMSWVLRAFGLKAKLMDKLIWRFWPDDGARWQVDRHRFTINPEGDGEDCATKVWQSTQYLYWSWDWSAWHRQDSLSGAPTTRFESTSSYFFVFCCVWILFDLWKAQMIDFRFYETKPTDEFRKSRHTEKSYGYNFSSFWRQNTCTVSVKHCC